MKITKTFDEPTDETVNIDKRTLSLIGNEADKSEYNQGFADGMERALEIIFGKGYDDE